ncbi:glycoside hydrolase family 76 protein [Seonamhaeicola aphaedonensis]|nr:glycoside hydrolase family 76 protein [Seonamhaeicola aphaedonensis]
MKRRMFIKNTTLFGASLFSLPLLMTLSSCKSSSSSEKVLKNQAVSAFNRFKSVWNFKDFWKRGNTFDACLVFVDALQNQWPDDSEIIEIQKEVEDMLKENLEFFHSYDSGKLWADDFGWWGLMALNARKHLLKIGNIELANAYLKLSTDLCWEYKKKTAYDNSDEGFPVLHGCRNGDANGESKGVKNTVTNVLLFLLSSRIYRCLSEEGIANGDKYLDMAYKQWVWFDEWFNLKDFEYLKKLDAEGVLVQERPMAFIEGSTYIEKIHPPWAEGWIWSGDQGMLVASLTDMLAIADDLDAYLKRTNINPNFDSGTFKSKINNLIENLAKGIQNGLIANVDGIMREAPCYSSFGPEHGRDYLAGRGIMVRYLAQDEIKKHLDIDLTDNISKTFEAIWNTRDIATNQFKPEFTAIENDKLYIEQFTQLWGLADDVYQWNLDKMKEKNKNGVCQSIGLDFLGATIRSLKEE